MNYQDYLKTIKRNVSALNRREKVAVCLKCCEKLSPHYSLFFETESWGAPEALRQSRVLAKSWLMGEIDDKSELQKQLLDITPDSDELGSVLSLYAQNSSIAHIYMMEQLNSDDDQPTIWVLEKCYETVDVFVQENYDTNNSSDEEETNLDSHPLIRQEIEWQCSELSKVRGCSDLVQFVEQSTD